MYHIPIVDEEEKRRRIEFCHIIDGQANERTWRGNSSISLDGIKINVFLRGSFSVVAEGESFAPAYGDFCVFSPHTVHYGRISAPTVLDYYQLDIGTSALDGVPGGRALLSELCRHSHATSPFVRPDSSEGRALIGVFERIELAIKKEDLPLAFAHTIEALSKMRGLLYSANGEVPSFLSRCVARAVSCIEEGYSRALTVEEIADLCGVSPSYLSRIFKKEIGVSVHGYLTNLRLSRSVELLRCNSVAETAAAVGFCDSSHFISTFRRTFGITPTAYLRKGDASDR